MPAPKKKAPAKKAPAKKAPAKPKSKAKPAKATSKAPAKPKAGTKPRDEQNGVVRPMKDGATKRVWEIADSFSKRNKVATRAQVLEKGLAEGLNQSTITTQYGRWRKYHGIEGRLAAA